MICHAKKASPRLGGDGALLYDDVRTTFLVQVSITGGIAILFSCCL